MCTNKHYLVLVRLETSSQPSKLVWFAPLPIYEAHVNYYLIMQCIAAYPILMVPDPSGGATHSTVTSVLSLLLTCVTADCIMKL